MKIKAKCALGPIRLDEYSGQGCAQIASESAMEKLGDEPRLLFRSSDGWRPSALTQIALLSHRPHPSIFFRHGASKILDTVIAFVKATIRRRVVW